VGGVLGERRGHFGVANGVRPFHGGHPHVVIEVASGGEACEVTFEVVFLSAHFALGAVYKDSVYFHRSLLMKRILFNNHVRAQKGIGHI
jgi:hypothetical protein